MASIENTIVLVKFKAMHNYINRLSMRKSCKIENSTESNFSVSPNLIPEEVVGHFIKFKKIVDVDLFLVTAIFRY